MLLRVILIAIAMVPFAAAWRGDTLGQAQTILVPSEKLPLPKLSGNAAPDIFPRAEVRKTQAEGRTEKPKAKSLTAEQQSRFQMGKGLYAVTCGACHQPHGNGQEGLAPPLTDSEWVMGSEQRLVRITLHGVRGPLTVKGKIYELEMPALSILDDDQIASLLTYIRREWGHAADPVELSTVAIIRTETEKRDEAWTEPELLKIP